MKALIALMLVFTAAVTKAGEIPVQQKPVLTGYECTIRLFAKDLPNNGFQEVTFPRPLQGGAHGGQPNSYTFGKHTVEALIDSKWRNLTWWIDGKLVAATVSAKSEVVAGYDTVILYNPANTDEEVSVACSPKFAQAISGK